MKQVLINTQLSLSKVVQPEDSAIRVGSGLVDVFATPALIALCEKTASELLAQYLDDGEVSVGINVNLDHTAASKIGANVKCIAKILAVDGRKVTFEITAFENEKIIGKGSHIRCAVNKQKFIDRLN